jgi:hypothetical protein
MIDHKADRQALKADNGFVNTREVRKYRKKLQMDGNYFANGKTDRRIGSIEVCQRLEPY